MKKLIIVLFCLFGFAKLEAQAPVVPPKTVFIKNPDAENTTAFFAASTTYFFEVYNVGGKMGIDEIKKSFEKDPAVATLLEGKLTGDYQAFNLTLKNPQNKGWFIMAFRNAGLQHIHINNHNVVTVDKM